MEREEKFTPGKWKAHTTQHADWVTTDWKGCTEQINICDCGKHNGWNDVYLIAAAPEMYEALQTVKGAMLDLLDCADLPDDVLTAADEALEKAEKAMKKARGEE